MTLDEQLRFVRNEAWVARMGLVAARVALLVHAEAPGTANHAERVVLATKVLTEPNPKTWAFLFAVAAASRPALPERPTDAQLGQAVASVWDAMAGAPPPA